jgi:hypothetical protein
MKNSFQIAIILFLVCFSGQFTQAAVIDSTQAGFTVRHEQSVQVNALLLYEAFTTGINKWWDPDHTWSGKAENLSLQPVPGGCFCENLGNGGWIRHMNVIYADPGKLFRMEGGLGPLQQYAITGVMTLEIKQEADRSMVSLTYTAGGYIPGGASKFAAIVDKVLGVQFQRFIGFALK